MATKKKTKSDGPLLVKIKVKLNNNPACPTKIQAGDIMTEDDMSREALQHLVNNQPRFFQYYNKKIPMIEETLDIKEETLDVQEKES